MTYPRHIQILTLFLFLGITASAQQENTDAVYLSQLKEYTLNKDGSWSYRYSHRLKLLSYFSFHTLYGEDFIVYNPEMQKLKINHSVTTMADGTKVVTPENAYNEQLPGFAANAPFYNNLREMAVTHTGLERGAVIDFDYTLSSSKDFSPAMTGNELLWMNSPLKELTFIINVPNGVTLNVEQYNVTSKPLVKKEASTTTYTWTLTNLPAATREDFRPREQQNRPRIVFSTAKNAAKLVESFLAQPAFTLKTDEVIQNNVLEIRKEKITDLAVMMRIQDMVANEINYHLVPLSIAGFRVRAASETYKSNGGTEAEKAVLLASMLSAAGIPSEVVAVIPDRFYDKKTFNLQLVERFLVKATRANEEPVYLSPLQNDLQDQRYWLAGKKIITLVQGKSLQVDTKKIDGNELGFTGNFIIGNSMDITGTISLELTNRLDPFLKLAQDSAYAKKLISGIFDTPEISLSTINRLNNEELTVRYQVAATGKIKEISGHYFLKIPSLPSGVDGWHMTEMVTQRNEPLEIPFLVNESYQYSITLPEGYEMVSPEVSLNLNKDFGFIKVNITRDGRTLQINRSIHLAKTTIEPADYAEFRLLLNSWNNRKYREIIFRKGPN